MNINARFRGFLPVVVDLETGGFDNSRHAVLELALVLLSWRDDELHPDVEHHWPITPYPGTDIEEASLKVTGIDLSDPNRNAVSEEDAFRDCFRVVRRAMKDAACQRAIVTAHNAHFDLGFINAAAERSAVKRNPFHPFSVIDTASLGAVAYGHTVLSEACSRAGIGFDASRAHNARYDAAATAGLFCSIVNRWGYSASV